ncbi:hypothetical protein Tco_0010959 [Tanacetum coccineum]
MFNPSPDTGIDSIFNLNTESTSMVDVLVTTISELLLFFCNNTSSTNHSSHYTSATNTNSHTKNVLSSSLQDLPNFGSLFRFDHRIKTLETDFSEFKQWNQFDAVVSSILSIVDAYLANKMHEAVKTAVQLQSNRLRDEAQAENADFINKHDDNIKKIIKDEVKEQVKAQVSKILPKIEKTVNEQLEAEVLTHDEDKDEEPSVGSNRGSKRRRARKEPESTSAPKEKTSKTTGKSTERSKSHHKSAGETAQSEEPMHTAKDLEEPTHQEFTLPVAYGPVQPWISTLAQKEDTRESFNKLIDTPLDFSAFVMNRLKVDTLTPELLAGPTFELMKGSCKSLVELEYFFEEVYKATTDQLDWNNPKGQQYPHDLRKPLPLILNSRVTKTKVADYGHIKWIEDLVPNRMWSQVPVSYDKHALWESHIGAENDNNSMDLLLTGNLLITVRRDDDKLYTFKEGDLNRLRIQDIKYMLILLVQGKLINLTFEERLAFNVSLRMFTRSIVIQRRVEDLQLGVKSYQKKLNLTKPDTYRSDLKRREAYTAYSNPKGFIYHNKDKKNRLMRIDELHKFCDGTLNDVRTTLNDCLKGIRMKYLPQTIWRQSDTDKVGAMIQAIDKRLKTRRIMWSLEKFVGERPYEGDF